MTFLNDLKNTAGQVLKKVGETVGELKDRAGLEYQIHQVRGQIKDAEDSARAAHEAMGKRVYELYKSGQITDKQLMNGCEEVEALAKKIEELGKQIADLREVFEREQATAKDAAPPSEPSPGEPPPEGGGSPGSGPAGSGPT